MNFFNKILKIRTIEKFKNRCKKESSLTTFMTIDFLKEEEIIIPEGVTSIGVTAFSHFTKLRKVVLPSTLERIETSAFYDCKNLEEIEIPEKVKYLGNNAFKGCSSLKKITIPNKVKYIPISAFADCISLEEVVLGHNVKEIDNCAFENCTSLKNININKNIQHIGSSSFQNCNSLEKIYLNDSVEISSLPFNNCPNLQIINKTSEIILSDVNNISKEKYSSLEELYQTNKNLREIINHIALQNKNDKEENIEKFKILFYKTRAKDMVPLDIFLRLSIEQAENFQYKLWKEIEKYIEVDDPEIAEPLINFMNIFGLFEKDENIEKRKDLFLKLISNKYKKCYIPSDRMRVLNDYKDNFEKTLKKTYIKTSFYQISKEFELYLNEIMPEEKVRKLKQIKGTYGSRLNKYIKLNYRSYEEPYYILKEATEKERQEISKLIFQYDLSETLTKDNIILLFNKIEDSCYNQEFLEFLISNLELIFCEIGEEYELNEIKKHFSEIKDFYLNAGKDKIDIYDCYRYIDLLDKQVNFGDERFIDYFKTSGAKKKSYEFYRDLYEKVKTKYKTTLPDTDITFDYYGNKIRIRRLSCNDPLQLFIGERNYTNCCQVYGDLAENCIEAISGFSNIGITIVELIEDNKPILLAQSLDWTNNGMYCHDNIQGTEFLHNNYDIYQEAVLEAYKKQAEEIMEKSQTRTNEYLKQKEKELSINRLKKLKERLEEQKIKIVTIGENHNDIDITNLKDVNCLINDNIESKTGCYSDSMYKKLLYGDETQININNFNNEPQIELFTEKRKTSKFSKFDITGEEILKIISIEEENNKKAKNLNYEIKKVENINDFYQNTTNDINNSEIIIGEDWYLIYSVTDEEIKIHDLKNGTLRDKEEKLNQALEIKNALSKVIEQSLVFDSNHNVEKRKLVKAVVNKNSTYKFYLYCIENDLIIPKD